MKLGVTAVELMPIQAFFDDRDLVKKKLVNYWGYNTVNYFSLAPRYISPGADMHEFQVLVRRLHEAGIEVILDVVYNHTAEGNHLGPTLSFRGIDNASYYMLGADKHFYFDTTGCGNTVNLRHPRVLQMVMDSLRYWVEECHVDGFRFDLATSLGREYDSFDPNAIFFDAVRQDPVLSRVKMIAEPWDVGPNGYQVGNFPPGFAEWNGRYRDEMRSYWKGDSSMLPAFARSILGSADMFEHQGRKPWASVNFITAHDGFTLTDLWSYNSKHNEANGEGNRDGHDDNRSWNCGVEGPTNDPAILDLRDRMRRNIMATHAALAGNADDPDGRRGRPDPAGQQQRLLPGQRDRLVRLEEHRRTRTRLHGVRARRHPHPQALPHLARQPFPARRANRRERHTERRLVPTRRPGDGRPATGATPMQGSSASCFRTTAPGCSSWPAPTTGRSRSRCRRRTCPPGRVRIDAGTGEIDPPDRRFAPGSTDRARRPLSALSRRGDWVKETMPSRERAAASSFFGSRNLRANGKPISRGGKIRRPRTPCRSFLSATRAENFYLHARGKLRARDAARERGLDRLAQMVGIEPSYFALDRRARESLRRRASARC